METKIQKFTNKEINQALTNWQNENAGKMPSKIKVNKYNLTLYFATMKGNKNIPQKAREFDVEKRVNEIETGQSLFQLYGILVEIDLDLNRNFIIIEK